MSSISNITEFSDEITLRFFELLDIKTLGRASLVCKSWAQIFFDSQLWKSQANNLKLYKFKIESLDEFKAGLRHEELMTKKDIKLIKNAEKCPLLQNIPNPVCTFHTSVENASFRDTYNTISPETFSHTCSTQNYEIALSLLPRHENVNRMISSLDVFTETFVEKPVSLKIEYYDLKLTCLGPNNNKIEQTFPWPIESTIPKKDWYINSNKFFNIPFSQGILNCSRFEKDEFYFTFPIQQLNKEMLGNALIADSSSFAGTKFLVFKITDDKIELKESPILQKQSLIISLSKRICHDKFSLIFSTENITNTQKRTIKTHALSLVTMQFVELDNGSKNNPTPIAINPNTIRRLF